MQGVDLFCGCGGLTQGFINSKIKITLAYDNWSEALDCYKLNFNHPVEQADLTNIGSISKAIAKLSPDIIIGGPPCQDFSSAGKREEKEQANLTICFARIIATVKPKWFVMENVDRAQKSATYKLAKEIFTDSGYGLTEEVLNACYYNVPQNRRRFFCVGLLKARDGFLSDDIHMGEQDKPMTIREYFNKIDQKININSYYRHPRSYARRAVFSIDEPSPTIRGVNRPVPKGYTGHNGDKHEVKETRPLTTQERALIQTFPKTFKLTASKSVAEQLIGNAVPVNLAQSVADAIFAYNQIMQPPKQGRKVKQEIIGGVGRPIFMRYLIRKGLKGKSLKDAWSWLSQSGKYIELDGHYADEDEIIYSLDRATKGKIPTTARSRMKKSLRYFQEFQEEYKRSKNQRLL